MARLILPLVCCLLLVSYTVTAKRRTELNMVALEFEGAIEHNKTGTLDFMLKDIAEKSGIPHLYDVLPPARGARMFFRKRATCMVPSSNYPPYFTGTNVIHSISFAKANYIAFTRPDSPTIEQKLQLTGKVIGVIRDSNTWNYKKRFALENVEYMRVSNLKSLVKLLYRKRIDVAIHDHQDFLAMQQKLKLPIPHFDRQLVLATDNVVITCHNTELARAYLEIVNPIIKQINQQGLMRQYLAQSLQANR